MWETAKGNASKQWLRTKRAAIDVGKKVSDAMVIDTKGQKKTLKDLPEDAKKVINPGGKK